MAEVVRGKISEARDVEVVIERPDGSHATVIVNIRPLKNERGNFVGAINCFYDISGRKQAEEAAAAWRKNTPRSCLAYIPDPHSKHNDVPASQRAAQGHLGRRPVQPGLIADLDAARYVEAKPDAVCLCG